MRVKQNADLAIKKSKDKMTVSSTKANTNFNSRDIIKDFPILQREVHPGKKVIYLDSAATSQKPQQVIDTMNDYYLLSNANIHRGIHFLAEEATGKYESARVKTAEFIKASKIEEIIFTKNTTESINLIAYSWGRKNLNNGDVVILTEMEHHSNLVPWQMLAQEKSIQLEFIPVTSDGLLEMEAYEELLKLEPKLVSVVHMSNVLGTINPVKEIISMAHAVGALVMLDGAQSAPHIPVDVIDLDVDFYAFSSHKMCGPTGLGVLYGKEEILLEMPPFLGGGDMIKRVSLRNFTPNSLPHKFEAGTPMIAEVIGFGAAIDYLNSIGMKAIAEHEQELIHYAIERLEEFPGVWVFGPEAEKKGGVAAFTMEGVHPHDVSQILDREGIAVRAGHHCAMPLHEKHNIIATSRASFYIYNHKEDVDRLIEGLHKVKEIFG
jgi:cysteine desulfurase/selenocysteine lyase